MRWYRVTTVGRGSRKPAMTSTPFRAPSFWPLALLIGLRVGRRAHRTVTRSPLTFMSVAED